MDLKSQKEHVVSHEKLEAPKYSVAHRNDEKTDDERLTSCGTLNIAGSKILFLKQ